MAKNRRQKQPAPSSSSSSDSSEEEDHKVDSDDDSSSEDEDNSYEEEDVTALFKGVSLPQNRNKRKGKNKAEQDDNSRESTSDDDDDDDDGDEEVNDNDEPPTIPEIDSNEECTFDLRNLLAVNSYQIAPTSLYQKKNKGKQKKKSSSLSQEVTTIPLTDNNKDLAINEDFLLNMASEGCTQLIESLWELPIEKSEVGPLVTLPSYDAIRIPRALPPPPPKQETKWEKFAKEKGIPLNKEKRSRKVWDEATGTWMYRHGYEKANNKAKEWPIMEVKATDDPYEDPWEKLRDAKRARTEKNIESRMRNEERAGALPRGTANRVMKSREHLVQQGRKGGNLDRDNPMRGSKTPVGVPVDLKPNRDAGGTMNGPQKRGKTSTVAALLATQRSTASLGKFDQMREGEPERRKALSALKKRKYELATDKKVIATEGEKSMKIFNAVVNGGGAAKEKARKKGMLAKGETAYDYDFDDGLGPSTFKKKKGRAGAGKMRKMTKKRVI